MDTLYSIDEERKRRARDFKALSEANRVYKELKTTQPLRAGLFVRFIYACQSLVGKIPGAIRRIRNQVTETEYRSSSAGVIKTPSG